MKEGVARGFLLELRGEDYHFILSRRMGLLIHYIKKAQNEDSRFKPMVDTGELIDVRVAERARVGFVGKKWTSLQKEIWLVIY